jgi:hypothetical protein
MVNVIRWIARVLAVLLIMLFVTMAFGEGLPNSSILTRPEKLGFLALFLMVAGLVSALRWELVGGILTLAGYSLFALINHEVIISWAFSLFPVAGILFLLSWALSIRRSGGEAKATATPDQADIT